MAEKNIALRSGRAQKGRLIGRYGSRSGPVPPCRRKPHVGRRGGRSPLSKSHTGKFESRPPSTM